MKTYLQELEDVVEEVSDWASSLVNEVTTALMPDGRPFQMPEASIDEQLSDYVQLRGNPQAWIEWIGTQAGTITTKLQDAGISSDDIASVHPFDIAAKFAIHYSAEMETQLRKQTYGQH